MNKYRKVVVIGGGIAGTCISRLLSSKGVNVELFEKSSQLCSGATWHAAGLVTRFGSSSKLKKIHIRSLQLLNELHDKYDIGLHTPGSIRLVESGNEARLAEARQHVSMAKLFDDPQYPTRLISVEEIKELHPLIDASNIQAGVYTSCDGDIDPTLLTNCVASLAKKNGTVFHFNAEITAIDRTSTGSYKLTTNQGNIVEADAVVNAAGLWSRNITNMVAELADDFGGMNHPAFVIEHQYAITEPINEVKELAKSGHNGGRLPVLRDLKGSSYIRQEGAGFLIGPYESECIVKTDWESGPPSTWGMELFPDELERIEENIMMGIEVLPVLGTVGFKTIVNGPTIWTGDSLARVGRTALPGWYDFNSLTYGIAQSLALSEYLAHIMLEGEQPYGFDCSDYFDPLRYGSWANDAFTEEKIKETYTHNNRIVYPYENRSGGRSAIEGRYPLHRVLKEHGAVFGPIGAAGIEVPFCFASDKVTDETAHDNHDIRDYKWQDVVLQEAQHVLNGVGLGYSSFSKIRIEGPDSLPFLEHVTTAVLPKKASKIEGDMPCKLTYAVSPKGNVCTEFTICRETETLDNWYLVGSRDHAHSDVTWLRSKIGEWDVNVTDHSDKICVLHIAGIFSKHLVASLDERLDDLPFMNGRHLNALGGKPELNVTVFRVSFSGEAGYEFHFPSELGPALHDFIFSHNASKELGLEHFGSAALNSLRIEKGFKLRADLDLAHYTEAGIEPFLAKKRQFLGKTTDSPCYRRSAIFQIDTPWEDGWNVTGDCPVLDEAGTVKGFTTTAALGAVTQKTIALGYLYVDHQGNLPESENMFVESYGQQLSTKVLQSPPAPMKGKD